MPSVKRTDIPTAQDIISLMPSPSKGDLAFLTKAYGFAKKAHEGHTRFSGEPYFLHLAETAKMLASLGMGSRTIAAGLLHDAVEDTEVKRDAIEKEFGNEVLCLVEGVTKLGALKYRGLSRHTESLRKLFVATSQDIRVLIIKLADRIHNMRTLEYVPKTKQKRIALETLEIYAPVADRLGMGQFKRELEDLAFPYVYPKEYKETTELLKQKNKETEEHLEKIQNSLRKELAKQGITNFTTEKRIKGLYSIYQKLKRKGGDITKIHDISAIRVIVPTVNDCYKVLGVIHGNWRPLPGEVKDYIAFHKPNGYRSLHTKIFTGDGSIVEVQIRTREMHNEAQFGIAAHLSYKSGLTSRLLNPNLVWIASLLPKRIFPGKQSTKADALSRSELSIPQWIKQIAEAQADVKKSDEFLEDLRTDFFSHRVFVFTPQGDVVDLPLNSSPIDFAYAIHSDIGDHMSGAKVNGRMVSLETKLQNGDYVEILTKKSGKPTIKWLDLAKTTFAKKRIRAAVQKTRNA